MAGKKRKRPLAVVHPNCAGIDIGSREHWVAVEPGHEDPVRRFTSFQDDLEALAEWLRSLEVSVVAMEATGVYWIPLYEVLGSKGFEVHLVNSRATRQVSGRKSDVLDCQWIQQLMSYGLLRGAYRPGQEVCALRAVVRQRQSKVQEQSRCVAHMQKALTQMNVQLDNVVSDLMGKTGLGIVRAIVAGERDPHKLAKLRDRRLRADEATVARSLYGHWREEHLFALSQALAHYDFLSGQIGECDEQIGHALSALPTVSEPTVGSAGKALQSRHRSAMQQKVLHQELQRVMGVDLTAIPTIGIETALVLVAEVGPDLSRFPSEGHFSSWLNLAPPTRITGGQAAARLRAEDPESSRSSATAGGGECASQRQFHRRRSPSSFGAYGQRAGHKSHRSPACSHHLCHAHSWSALRRGRNTSLRSSTSRPTIAGTGEKRQKTRLCLSRRSRVNPLPRNSTLRVV